MEKAEWTSSNQLTESIKRIKANKRCFTFNTRIKKVVYYLIKDLDDTDMNLALGEWIDERISIQQFSEDKPQQRTTQVLYGS